MRRIQCESMAEDEFDVDKKSLVIGISISSFGINFQSYVNCDSMLSSCILFEGILKIIF